MRFIAKVLSAVIPLTLLLSAPVSARDWSTIKSSGTIIAVTEGQYAPFNYYEGKKLTGYEIDVAEAIAKQMGLKLEWRTAPFDAQVAAVSQDRFDFAIASHGHTEERAKAVDFAAPHYCSGAQIAAKKNGPLTAAELKGKTAGVQIATSYYDAAKKIDGIKEVKTYKADPEAFAALVEVEGAIYASKVQICCSKCGATRVKHAEKNGKKIRVCAKCGAAL